MLYGFFLACVLFTCDCLINVCTCLLPGFTLDRALHGDKKHMSRVTWHIGGAWHAVFD